MVSADSFHGKNAFAVEQFRRFADATFTAEQLPVRMAQIVAWSAVRASNRLRVKAAIAGIFIFSVAVAIERPISHGSVGAVIGQTEDNRVARTTVRTVDIGIPISPVRRVQKLAQARIADREVGRNANRGPFPSLALADGELIQANRRRAVHFDFRDARRGRSLGFQILHESSQPGLGAFEENLDSLLAVQHPPGERVGLRQAIDVGPEANALHYAANSNRTSAGHGYSAPTMQLRPCQPT